MWKRLYRQFGMLLVLLALCAFFSALTVRRVERTSREAIATMLQEVQSWPRDSVLVIVAGDGKSSREFADLCERLLDEDKFVAVHRAEGQPLKVAAALDALAEESTVPAAVLVAGDVAEQWTFLQPDRFGERFGGGFEDTRLISPGEYAWPVFLTRSNFEAILNRIVVIAIVAIGMTLVIISAGIDLSVGSLVALSGVTATLAMQAMGGKDASVAAIYAGVAVGSLACLSIGVFSGVMVAYFRVAPFIVTLAIMMVGRGFSLRLTGGNTIYDLPSSFEWLGQGRNLGVGNSVWLMVLLYVVAHLVMTRTRFGRYVYAIGGNEQAARLSGVPVRLVLVSLYAISALAAALGGFICASRVCSGVPKPPDLLEMYVIAAVVVGGTSLAGGSGSIPGTLVGALIIAVIQNGMNLMNIDSYTQYIVLGAIILGAVLVDGLRHSERFRRRLSRPRAADAAGHDGDGSG